MKAGIDVNHGNGASFYSDTDSLKSSVLGSTPLPLNSEQSTAFGDYYSLQVKKLEGESMVATPFTPVPVDIINMHGDLNRVVPAGFIMLYNKLDEIQKESSQKGSTFLGAGGLGGGTLAALGAGAGIAAGAGAAVVAIAAAGPGAIAAANVDWDAYAEHMKKRDAAATAEPVPENTPVLGPGDIAANTTPWDAYGIHMLKRNAMARGQLMTTSEAIEEETTDAVQTYTDYLMVNGATVDEVETAKENARALQTGAASNPYYNSQPRNYLLAKQAIDIIPRGTWQYNVIMNYISASESGDMVMAQNLWDGENGAKAAISSYSSSAPNGSPSTPLTVMGPGNIAAATTDWSGYYTYIENRDAAEVARREAAALNDRVEAAPSTTTTLAEANANFKSSFEAVPKSTTSNAKELLQTVVQGASSEQKKAIVETLEDIGITEKIAETLTDPTTLNALAHFAQQEKSKITNTGATAAQVADPSKAVPGYDIKQMNPNTPVGANGQLYTAPSAMTAGDYLPAGAMPGVPATVLTSGVGIAM